MSETKTVVGIDVSKKVLDCFALPHNLSWQALNQEKAYETLCEKLASLAPSQIVLESTGHYHLAVAGYLQEKGFCVVVVNPQRVRSFAKAIGQVGKTDKQDAQILAQYACLLQPAERKRKESVRQELSAYLDRRNQLVKVCRAEKQRYQKENNPVLKAGIQEHLNYLKEAIAQLEESIESFVQQCEGKNDVSEILQSVPGIGPMTTATILAELPELGTVSRQEIAALVGIAPMNRDSGQWRGNRYIYGGRRKVRTALFQAAVVARRFNPVIQAFYQRLKEKGKSTKQATIACARKLLVILNAMLKHQQPWQPKIMPV